MTGAFPILGTILFIVFCWGINDQRIVQCVALVGHSAAPWVIHKHTGPIEHPTKTPKKRQIMIALELWAVVRFSSQFDLFHEIK